MGKNLFSLTKFSLSKMLFHLFSSLNLEDMGIVVFLIYIVVEKNGIILLNFLL